MNHAHSVFSPNADSAQSLETLSRRWKYFLLDFSGVKDVGELSAKVLFDDDGEREDLDYEVIEVPATVSQGAVVHSHYMLYAWFQSWVHQSRRVFWRTQGCTPECQTECPCKEVGRAQKNVFKW